MRAVVLLHGLLVLFHFMGQTQAQVTGPTPQVVSAYTLEAKTEAVRVEGRTENHSLIDVRGPGFEMQFRSPESYFRHEFYPNPNSSVGRPILWVEWFAGASGLRVRVFNLNCPDSAKPIFDGYTEEDTPTHDERPGGWTITTVERQQVDEQVQCPKGTRPDMNQSPGVVRTSIEFSSCETKIPRMEPPQCRPSSRTRRRAPGNG